MRTNGLPNNLILRVFRSVLAVEREAWNALVQPETAPFLEWEWLAALEESGSIAPGTGWHPVHLTLWDGGRLAAAAPLYLKTHSMGEFVFDQFWAEAAYGLGRDYYPKLVGVVPATPAEGYRFLSAAGLDEEEVTLYLLDAAERLCRDNGIPGLHILFPDPAWAEFLDERRYLPWTHHRYLWENHGYSDFGGYLAAFSKNQRRNILRERNRSVEQDIDVRLIPGTEAPEAYFRHLFDLYSRTNDKFVPWDARFVNEKFFGLLESRYRHRSVFSAASRNARQDSALDSPLALAYLVRKGDRLWGRYWGSYEDLKDLHFSVCYYLPIDWCIKERIAAFDPGAGSPHKIRRGFRARPSRSFHRLFDPVLNKLFRANLPAVNEDEEARISELNAESPLKEDRRLNGKTDPNL